MLFICLDGQIRKIYHFQKKNENINFRKIKMAAVKKMTVKILSEEFYKLKAELKEYTSIKKKVFDLEIALVKTNIDKNDQQKVIKALEKKVEHLQKAYENEVLKSNSNNAESIPRTNCFECKKCDINFDNRSTMKKHMKDKHQKNSKCYQCDQTFNLNIDLEVHLQTHEKQKLFKCDQCEQNFYLKWRLRKHQEGHANSFKFCHYFNNELTCPFEEHGCMFLHKISPLCKFGATCANQLCQFRHQNKQTQSCDKSENKNTTQSESADTFSCQECEEKFPSEKTLTKHVETKHEDEIEEEDEVYPCDTCDNIYNEIEDLIDHYGETAHNN